MSSMMTTSSPALAALVTFLTRPLNLKNSCIATPNTVISLQFMLYSNLSPLFAPYNTDTFTLTLTVDSLPITAISAACIAHNISWAAWMGALSPSGSNLLVTISPKFITVAASVFTRTLWSAPSTSDDEVVCISKMRQGLNAAKSRLQMTLESARARRSSAILAESIGITLPSLSCTASPATVVDVIDVDLDSHSSSSDDSDSDSEGSTYSFASSHDSLTSVSSTSSSPVSAKASLPSLYLTPKASKSTPNRHLSRSQRSQRGLLVDSSKIDVTKYLYQGGSTGVITGGVMLGSSSPPRSASPTVKAGKASPYRPAQMRQMSSSPTKPARKVLLGPERDNWRV